VAAYERKPDVDVEDVQIDRLAAVVRRPFERRDEVGRRAHHAIGQHARARRPEALEPLLRLVLGCADDQSAGEPRPLSEPGRKPRR
jgi:hypothetical protein